MFAAAKWVSWDQAVIAACLSWAVAYAMSRRERTTLGNAVAPAAREFAFISATYAIWRLARQLPLAKEEGALERARSIVDWQQRLHLPSELGVQQWVIEHDQLAQLTAWYYAILHVPALIGFVVWLWVRQREHYQRWRTALVLVTAFSLVIRFIRVAPPRFLPELGFVDLSNRLGFSVYGEVGTGASDQFAAMPSIHVAWAAVVSFGVFAATTSRWRWVVMAHVWITMWVVAATGHHWWLDGIAALALLWLSLMIDTYGRRLRSPQLSEEPEPVKVEQ